MASIWCLCYCNISPCLNKKGGFHIPQNTTTTNTNTTAKQPVLRLQNEDQKKEPYICVREGKGDGHGYATSTKRRQIMLQGPPIAFSFPQLIMSNALAETDVPQDFRAYTDNVNMFKILIPQDWQVGAGEPNGFKSITAFYPEEAANSNGNLAVSWWFHLSFCFFSLHMQETKMGCSVSVVITGLGPDFTKMESFGKVEAFADTLVSGLDRSWQRPPGVAAKLIDCKAANGFYYIEYTLQKPGEGRKHLFSAIGMASNGWYNRLYTVTGQFVEEEAEKYGSKIEKAVSSFRFI